MRVLASLPTLLILLAGCLSGDDDGASGPAEGTEDDPLGLAPALPGDLVVPTLLPSLELGDGAGEPNIAVAADGTIYVSDPGINVWRSTDGGATFARQAASGIEGGGDGDICLDGTGRLHWLGLFGESGPIPYQHSDDQGASFSSPVDISNGTGGDREWIECRPDGTVYASWRGSDGGASVISATASFDGGGTWAPLAVMAPDAVGGPIVPGPVPGQVYEAMTTFADSPAAQEGQGGAIELARSADHGRTWEVVPVLTPPQSAQFGLIGFPTSIFPVVAVDSDGTLYVVFSADQRTLPQTVPKPAARFSVYLMSSKDQGQTWTGPILLSDPDHVALMPFIDAGAPGRVAIVWYENTAGLPADVLPDAWNVMLWESITADQSQPEGVLVQLNGMPNHVGAVCTSGTGCLAGDRSLLDFFEVAIQPNGHPVAAWSYSVAGTGIGVAAQGTSVWFGGVADGTPLL